MMIMMMIMICDEQVKVVAMIKSHDVKSTTATYMVEDGTGVYEVKSWIDQDGGAQVSHSPPTHR